MATILVVDDDPDILLVVRLTFEGDDHEVAVLDDPRRVLALTEEIVFDAIILDVMMPGISGWDLLAALRKNQRTSSVPIIMLSALDEGRHRLRGLQAGADEYLAKPFDPTVLRARVEELIAGHARAQVVSPALDAALRAWFREAASRGFSADPLPMLILVQASAWSSLISLVHALPAPLLGGEAARRALLAARQGSLVLHHSAGLLALRFEPLHALSDAATLSSPDATVLLWLGSDVPEEIVGTMLRQTDHASGAAYFLAVAETETLRQSLRERLEEKPRWRVADHSPTTFEDLLRNLTEGTADRNG